MCGRYVKEITDHVLNYHEYLHDFIDASRAANATSQYNVAPTTMQDLRCVDDGCSIVQPGKWGLVPHWSKDGKGYQINARAETCHEKPMFKKSFQQRR